MNKEYVKDWQAPDDELLDLIEAAFMEGQIDGEQLLLASAWAESETPREH